MAGQEGIDLTPEGAALLARLADGGLRDALSLLDQCSGGGQKVDEQAVLDTLGLAGNLETARLMELAARHDTAAALETLSRLYAGGKDVGAVLGELSSLARDLLMRKTAPRGGSALLTGGYDETTMRGLGELLTAPRLLQMLNRLQDTAALLPRSSSRRTDAGCASSACATRRWTTRRPDCPPGSPGWRSSWPPASRLGRRPVRRGTAGRRSSPPGLSRRPWRLLPGRRSVRPCRRNRRRSGPWKSRRDGLRRSRLPSRPSPEARAPSGPLSRRRPSESCPPRGPIW